MQGNTAEVVYDFDGVMTGPRQLLRDERGDWHLGDNGQPSQKVTIDEALVWYARQREVETDSTGDISPLCIDAARSLKALSAHVSQ